MGVNIVIFHFIRNGYLTIEGTYCNHCLVNEYHLLDTAVVTVI